MTRPVVFFDVALGESALGRIKIELFNDITPKTAENFRQLCTGEQRVGNVPQGYKNSTFHSLKVSSIKDFMGQRNLIARTGGDFLNGDGTGSYSIYGGAKFQDENFTVKHDQPGLLSMANSGPNTNGCQFFITCKETPFLDGKHTVFGKVTEGMLTLRKIENVQTGANNKPKLPVRITQCGEM
ncbi:rotamase H [Wallemia mellicola]|uniref:Peptidyl-prolyl cis-trans isomerase n=1 Tax=Wallemia mellicola TaxID=1708541 RepID=A0A4T0NU11_9BASI|nr:hypothetical protein E3Q24_00235 [Wallemia mellicola]TIB78528.1 hypothetical protein E3Q23_00756 [Wallemia mellicola]TIB81203.1 rotamase H [Wallemia mellicola]TIB89115.1 rotamase H [Wallemia mellicola]TIB91646.1 rotamase H [Wallemia mellicola]